MVDIKDVANKINQPGAIGVIPTDTVYGVVARASDQTAVARLYKLKNRESKPGTIIAASIDQLVELGIKRRYLTAVKQFWPGAVSVIIACADPDLRYIHQGVGSLPVRIPSDKATQAILQVTGPLLTSSANNPGEPPASKVEQARITFGDNVDFYIDGGDLSNRQPSTIIRVVDDAIEVIRPGAVKIDENLEE